MEKACGKCNRTLPVREFHRNSRNADGLSWRCKKCAHDAYMANRDRERARARVRYADIRDGQLERARERYATDPEVRKAARARALRQRLRGYGLTVEQYDALVVAQGGVCAICRQPDRLGRRLAVDHDHTCCPRQQGSCGECVRGLLCFDCNTVLGKVRDDPARLRAAADYLVAGRSTCQ